MDLLANVRRAARGARPTSLRFAVFFVLTAFLLLITTAQTSFAQPRLAAIFGDGAVLQRRKPIAVWGWANPGERITVRLGSEQKIVAAGSDGRFRSEFAAMEAGGPYELSVSSAAGTVTRKDLLIGEVWLCSGQSNMEWTVKQSDNFATERENAEFPAIRHFFVEHDVRIKPLDDLPNGAWKSASRDTVGDFTAVGFFFAREVHQRLGVPVGLIHSSWGGSQIEGWISRESMLESAELADYGRNLPTTWEEADARLEKQLKKKTLGREDAAPTLADERKYVAEGYDFSGWHEGSPMWQWDWQGIWAWRGNGYLARTIDVPASFATEDTVFGLAELFSQTDVYINGRQVFAGTLKGKREIIVPRGIWKSGANNVVIKLNKAIEPEWFGVGLMGKPEDFFIAGKDQRIVLGNLRWKMMPSFAEPHFYNHSSNNVGTTIYNGMIAPLVGYTLRGVLWYQGETNAGRSYQYRATFPLLINDWRKKWNDQFDFYFVQLSSFGGQQDSNSGSGWAELREAQSMTLSVPKTGMAVTTDIGNPSDVHPTNKQDVGKRLAAVAFKRSYGLNAPDSGPVFEKLKIVDSTAIVSFEHVYGGLVAKDKYGYLRGFEIAGADRKFYFAQATIKGNQIVVSSPQVKVPVAVRYAWTDAPIDANLYNGAGFPASSFRTDDWPGVTVNAKFQ